MFSIGIFSTNIPYIAFVVFYVYFLAFGTKSVENKAVVFDSASPIQVEQQINTVSEVSVADCHFHQSLSNSDTHSYLFILVKVANNWQTPYSDSFFVQNQYLKTPFNRPPPENSLVFRG